MKNTIAVAALVSIALTPAVGWSQSVPAEAFGGLAGGAALGFVGMAAGMGVNLCVTKRMDAVPPIVGAALGASIGMIGGVVAGGEASGGYGTVGGATAGFAVGALSTAAMWGVVATNTRERGKAGAVPVLLMIASVALPLAGTIAGYHY